MPKLINRPGVELVVPCSSTVTLEAVIEFVIAI
jgi:hypothetical protein